MPYPNEHAARIRNPKDFDPDTFRRTRGGTIYGHIDVPATIDIIWAKLKRASKPSDPPLPQALRFDKTKWTVAQSKKWLEDKNIKYEAFEPAAEKSMEIKTYSFELLGCEEKERQNAKYGYIKGYASTFGNKDRGDDIVEQGAFTKSLDRYVIQNRPVRMKYQHHDLEIIGGWSAQAAKEDEKGLYLEGEINLDVQRGREVYSLAKQGVLSDLSIGYSVIDSDYTDDGARQLKELELWEVSIVAEPMNIEAQITDIKSPYQKKDFEDFSSLKDIENFLREPYSLSRKQRKILIAKIKAFSSQRDVDEAEDHIDDYMSQAESEEGKIVLNKINELIKLTSRG